MFFFESSWYYQFGLLTEVLNVKVICKMDPSTHKLIGFIDFIDISHPLTTNYSILWNWIAPKFLKLEKRT